MKKIKNILCLVLLTLLVSCKDEYVEHGKLNDFTFTTSFFTKSAWNIAAGKYVIFSDLSQGALTHEWSILSDSCSFLEGNILRADTVFDSFEVPGLISTSKNITVLFLKGGVNKVRIRNTFSDSVCFRGSKASPLPNTPAEKIFFPSKKVGNVWVMDTTFTVNVYGKSLFDPKVEITLLGGKPITTDTITVKVKTILYFRNVSGGFPTAQNFSFSGLSGTPALINRPLAAISLPVKFTIAGIYDNNFMTTYRDADLKNNLPAAPTISLTLPVINVIP